MFPSRRKSEKDTEMVRIEKERGDAIVREMDALLNRMKDVADKIEQKVNSVVYADTDSVH